MRPPHKRLHFLLALTVSAFALLLSGPPLTKSALAAEPQWLTMICTEQADEDLCKILSFCFQHDVASPDLFWANGCTPDDLTPGRQLYLPRSRFELLSVWQKTHGTAAEKRLKKEEIPEAPLAPASSSSLSEAAQPSKTRTPPLQTKKSPAAEEKETASPKQKPLSDNETEAPENRPEDEKKREPVLFLSPDGDDISGPMRLVISGDKVAVVRLPKGSVKTPKNALPPMGSFYKSPFFPDFGETRPPAKGSKGNKNGKMIWPVDGTVSSGFGPRGKRRFHYGIDIPMPKGTAIRAARDGVVTHVTHNRTPGFRGYGNSIIIDHGNGISTLYAHCLTASVKRGQRVKQGDVIGKVGRTGRASTNHVHFEVRVRGKPVNPIPYLARR